MYYDGIAQRGGGTEWPDQPAARVRVVMATGDAEALRIASEYLMDRGVDICVATSWRSALARILDLDPHAVILGTTLADASGLDLPRMIRQYSQAPILFVSAKADVHTRLLALGGGADDFILWPTDLGELFARLTVAIRRHYSQAASGAVEDAEEQLGSVRLDVYRHDAYADGRRLWLTPTEFAILRFLMTHIGKAVSRENIIEAVWGDAFIPGSNVIDRHICALRRKLGPDAPDTVETVSRIGYRLASASARAAAPHVESSTPRGAETYLPASRVRGWSSTAGTVDQQQIGAASRDQCEDADQCALVGRGAPVPV